MKAQRTIAANERQAAHLARLVAEGRHLYPPKGLMIDDPQAVAALTSLAGRLGVSRPEALKEALRSDLARRNGFA